MNNLLRYGALPVCVLEGQSPPEKLELVRARFKAVHGCEGGGGGNRTFNKTQQHIAKMLHAMVSLLDCFTASVQLVPECKWCLSRMVEPKWQSNRSASETAYSF